MQMKMHMKTVHRSRPKRLKRPPMFTPIIEDTKRKRQEYLNMNTEAAIKNESLMLLEESFMGTERSINN